MAKFAAIQLLTMTETEFEHLFRTHFAMLSNVAYAVVKDKDQAKDIVQHVFIKFWDKRNDLDMDGNMKSYLHKAVINTSYNYIEKTKKIQLEEDFKSYSNTLIEEPVYNERSPEEMDLAIKQAIGQLPDKCQVVFSLSRFEGMSNKEIADELEISIKAVEKHISRALRELRITLKPYLNNFSVFLWLEVGLALSCLLLQ